MPRDGSKNLIPLNKRTKEQQQEIARKGGIASQKKQKERKTFKEQFLLMFENDPNLQQQLIQAHLERCKIKYGKGANAGNTAFMNLLEIIGEAPVIEQKIEVENVVEDLQPLAKLLGANISELGNVANNENSKNN